MLQNVSVVSSGSDAQLGIQGFVFGEVNQLCISLLFHQKTTFWRM